MTLFPAKKVLILGYGREGQSTHRYLIKHAKDAEISIADSSPITPISESPRETKVFSGEGYLSQASSYDLIIHSPGIVLRELPGFERFSGVARTTGTDLFFSELARRVPGARTIGVTGTKGKSTTSSLIAHLISPHLPDVRLAGNIGLPMLDYLEDATNSTVFVLELSSFQLEYLTKSPDIGVLLNIVPEHLDHHGSFEEYVESKSHITSFQKKSAVFIYNEELSIPTSIAQKSSAMLRPFSTAPAEGSLAWVSESNLYVRIGETVKKLGEFEDLPLKGKGNLQNMLAALTCSTLFTNDATSLYEGLKSFTPLAHRLEPIGEFCGIRFYNDSLSTIPQALENALSALGAEVSTVIAGGFDRGLDYSSTAPALRDSHVKNLILFPTTGYKIEEALKKEGLASRFSIIKVSSMEEAVSQAFRCTETGKVCVLSPASSSFNMFRDYRERGERFKECVRRLGETDMRPLK